jgi:co-chaperonin GroES (HSP10)
MSKTDPSKIDFLSAFAEPIPAPLTYHVVVRPKPPRDKKGLIALAARTKRAELETRTIGQLVAVGDLAFKASMRNSGINFQEDNTAQSLKVGDWVVYRSHAGQRVKIANDEYLNDEDTSDTVPFLVIMPDTDILAKLTAEQADRLYDWV